PARILDFLRGRASERKLRLFALACCRRIWGQLVGGKSREALELAESYVEGLVSDKRMTAAAWGLRRRNLAGTAASVAIQMCDQVRHSYWNDQVERATEVAR